MKSVLTKYNGFCIFCGKPTQTEHHLLFGIGIRELAEEDGVKIPVCDAEHNMAGGKRQISDNSIAEKLSKIAGQLAWEKEYYRSLYGNEDDPAREAFRERYGRSYL
jgi:hypothetical protein